MSAAVETEWSPRNAESLPHPKPGGEIEWELVDCLLCGGSDFEPLVEAPDFTSSAIRTCRIETFASPRLRGEEWGEGLSGCDVPPWSNTPHPDPLPLQTRGEGQDVSDAPVPVAMVASEITFTVVRCRDCGLAFTNPRPTPQCIGRFYPPGYGPHEGHEWSDGWSARLRRRFERAVLRTSFGYAPQPATTTDRLMSLLGQTIIRGRRRRAAWIPFRGRGRLLDFGCGAARFGRLMREYGWRVEGVDVSADVAARTEHTAGFPVHVGSLPHVDVRPESFDVVTMWASLEHVHDPRSVIAGAYDVLTRDGMLLVYVPNFASWAARRFGAAWWGLELPRHLVHFTPQTLSELLGREGFRITRLEHIGRDGWLRRSARRSVALDNTNAGAPSHAAWAACRWKPAALAVSRWTEWTCQAESLLVWAEKA